VAPALSELETPVVTVDLDRFERNVAEAADYGRAHSIALLPHAKTHKTLELARRQLAAGAAGLTVAKSEEAATYAAHGVGPLLVHYPVFGAAKWERLARVAGEVELTVALDSIEVAAPLAAALRRAGTSAEVLVELDIGLGRTGLDPAGAVAVGEDISRLEGGLELAGLSCYPGHLRDAPGTMAERLAPVRDILDETRATYASTGLRCDRVSGGSTATFRHSHEIGLTEARPGNYVFLDRAETTDLDRCALRVVATVVSCSVPGRAVVDAGSKTLSEAGPARGLLGYGAVIGHPDVAVVALNEEHGYLDISGSDHAWRVGDRVELIPNHACTCVNLHDRLVLVRNAEVVEEIPVMTRGMVR
jgi:D-serine deaminase-like pyridoxal phosphate-dependent protein